MIRLQRYYIYLAIVVGLSLCTPLGHSIPFIGSLLGMLTIPLFWLLEEMGYFVSFFPVYLGILLAYFSIVFLPTLGALCFKKRAVRIACVIVQVALILVILCCFVIWYMNAPYA